MVLLANDDEAGYRDLCVRMLGTFSGTNDPGELRFVACACFLAPDAVEDSQRVLGMARKALTAQPDNINHIRACAACLYRCGEWEESIAMFDRADAHDKAQNDYLNCFQAMAYHRLGHTEEALACRQRVYGWKAAWTSGTPYYWRVPGERLIAEMDSVLKTEPYSDSLPSEERGENEASQRN